jgi:hypothetical protein
MRVLHGPEASNYSSLRDDRCKSALSLLNQRHQSLVANNGIYVGAGSESAPIVIPPRPVCINYFHGVTADS